MQSLRKAFKYYVLGIVAIVAWRMALATPESKASFFTGLRRLIAPIGKLYLELFQYPEIGILLSLSMIVLGAGFLANFWFRFVWPTKALLARLRQAVLDARSGSMTQRLDSIATAFKGIDPLADRWAAYRASLFTTSSGDDRAFYSTQDPAHYFNFTALPSAIGNPAFYLSLSNYFVGLGLGLTFLGLVAGLFFASQGMHTANMEQARTALVQLLNASTFKFLTSVTGIALSITISILIKAGMERIQGQLDQLCFEFEKLLPYSPAERLLVEELQGLRSDLQLLLADRQGSHAAALRVAGQGH